MEAWWSLQSHSVQEYLHANATSLQRLHSASLGRILGHGRQHQRGLPVPKHLHACCPKHIPTTTRQFPRTLSRPSLHPWRWIFRRDSDSSRNSRWIFTSARHYSRYYPVSARCIWLLFYRWFYSTRKLWYARSGWSVEMDQGQHWKFQRRSFQSDASRWKRWWCQRQSSPSFVAVKRSFPSPHKWKRHRSVAICLQRKIRCHFFLATTRREFNLRFCEQAKNDGLPSVAKSRADLDSIKQFGLQSCCWQTLPARFSDKSSKGGKVSKAAHHCWIRERGRLFLAAGQLCIQQNYIQKIYRNAYDRQYGAHCRPKTAFSWRSGISIHKMA